MDFVGENFSNFVVDEVRAKGYFAARRSLSRWGDIKKVILSLGGNRIRSVRIGPKNITEARPNTLSSMYGFGDFPIHTDYVFDAIPPRYILLVSPRIRGVKTCIYDSSGIERGIGAIFPRSIFIISSSKQPFYSKFLETVNGKNLVRYNGALSRPMNDYAQQICTFLPSWQPDFITDWIDVKWLLIDNWRCLHSRSALSGPYDSRAFRLAIWVEK